MGPTGAVVSDSPSATVKAAGAGSWLGTTTGRSVDVVVDVDEGLGSGGVPPAADSGGRGAPVGAGDSPAGRWVEPSSVFGASTVVGAGRSVVIGPDASEGSSRSDAVVSGATSWSGAGSSGDGTGAGGASATGTSVGGVAAGGARAGLVGSGPGSGVVRVWPG
jgi:hypothetical protein